MRRRAESVPEIANQCSDFEEDNSKSRIRIFGWSVSDAIAEILERIRVGKYSLHEDDGSSGAEEQMKNQPSESKRRDELDLETRELHMQLTDIQQPIRTAESVRETINQDGAVLLDIKQGVCFSMNPVGAKIWEMLKKEHSLEQIAESLESEFSLPRSQVEGDVCEFTENLLSRKLVRCGNQERTVKESWLSQIFAAHR